MNTKNALLKRRLNEASNKTPLTVGIERVVESANAAKSRRLTESKAGGDEPLAKTFIQYIKDGNVLSPAGNVTLVSALDNCPYEIKQTMQGVVFERVKPNTDEVMVFEDSPLNKVVKEIDKFWEAKAAYDKLGLMHNRGIVLYGPPGTGKSIALQQVVESMAKRGDVVFFVKSPEAIVEGMKAFRQIEPDRKVVVSFEEAEEMCRYNERTMLRIMDGDAKINGVLFLATTNYLDQMSPRMLRPGRFDEKIYVGPPTLEHRIKYLTHKLSKFNETTANITDMARKTEGLGFGHLRELIAGVYAIGKPVSQVLSDLRAKATKFSQTID